MLSLSVAMAISVDALLRQFPAPRRNVLGGAFALLLILDYVWLPYPTRELPRPEWIEWLTQQPADLAVLDISSSHRGSGGIDMYLQTLHQRPIVGGYVSADLKAVARRFRDYPQLRRVFRPLGGAEGGPKSPSLVESIRQLEAGLVVVHLRRTAESEAQARLVETRNAPNLPYRLRLYSPRQQMSADDLEEIRGELLDAFGSPVHHDSDVEIYLVR